jgi:hypothetical protein
MKLTIIVKVKQKDQSAKVPNSAIIKRKIQIPVIVLTLARKKIFLRWALEGFKSSKIQEKSN